VDVSQGLRAIELAEYHTVCPSNTYYLDGKCYTHPVKQSRLLA